MGSLPAAPLASTSTVSFVLGHPSTTSALKLPSTAASSACCSGPGSTATSVVSTASIVAIDGASIAAPLAMPPTVAARGAGSSTGCTVTLRTVSVVSMASAAATPPAASAVSCAPSSGTPDSIGVHRHRDADEAGLAHEHVGGRAADGLRGELAHAQRVGPALVAGGGVGVAGVEHDRGGAAVGQVAAADLHRRRGHEVGGEHAGRAATGASSTVATMARSGSPDSLMPDASPPAANPGTAVTLTA